MSNGVAYVLDESDAFRHGLHRIVTLAPFEGRDESVQSLLHEHLERTGSPRAGALIARWKYYRGLFRKVVPNTLPGRAPEPVSPPASEGEAVLR
jgi:glutamate synthase domain-containing protein 3